MALPAGVITCAFTDIEGSTRLLKELGPRFEAVLGRHNDVLREVWRAHDGHEVKTLGDAFLVVFADAGRALSASVAAQRAIAAVDWGLDSPIRIRMGMHAGYARPSDGDYTALVVNQAARIVGAAHGGQVLVSDSVVAAAGMPGPPSVEVRSLGRFRVRDFDEPVTLHAVGAPDVARVDAPPRVRPADGHNIVRPTTSLVGREDDEAALAGLLGAGAVAVVVGPGGVGKTRLATETALRAAEGWGDGAWFVDLAPLEDGRLVAEAIGDAVGAAASPVGRRWTEVLDHLEERQALLVLDNAEHLRAAVATAATDLLARCPRVGLLVTSRVPLGIRGERLMRLAPLSTDGPRAPAVELFLARAAAADMDPAQVAELCAEVDGLPLAIELAAARTSAVPVSDLLARLRRTPAVLRSTDPTLPERQRSLQRLLDYSWELLGPGARTVLARLSVFAAGFDVDEGEAVAGDDEVPAEDVAEHLWDLVDASLVRLDDAAGATRYRLPVTVRAHAARRGEPADLTAATDRLARLLLERVGPAQAMRQGWVAALQLELENVRSVVAHATDPAAAQALGWCVGRLHDLKDRHAEGVAEVGALLEARPQGGPERTALLTLLADLHLRGGATDDASALLERAADEEARVGVAAWEAGGVARARADLALRRGAPAEAAALVEGALRQPVGAASRARLLDRLGMARSMAGDLAGAQQAFEEALDAAISGGLRPFLALAHGNLAETRLRRGDDAGAASDQLLALGLAREHGQEAPIAFAMMVAARMSASRGAASDALALQAHADQLLARIGFRLYEEDERVRRELVATVAAALGPEASAAATARGVTSGTQTVADLAEAVLREVGSALVERRREGP